MTEFTLASAVALASAAHSGQVDKGGKPYIHHPLRVMRSLDVGIDTALSPEDRLIQALTRRNVLMAAVLHDVIEDSDYTLEDLEAEGCPAPVVAALAALTHPKGEPYRDYLARVAANPIALVVKRADIADNADPARLALLPPETAERLRAKYARGRKILDQIEADGVVAWEPCSEDSCWDIAYVTLGHHERTFWTILSLAQAMRADVGPIAALMAWSGRWDKGWSGISPQSGWRTPCDEAGEALIESDEDGDPVQGCTKIQPTTWVTMDPDVADPRADGPLRVRTAQNG